MITSRDNATSERTITRWSSIEEVAGRVFMILWFGVAVQAQLQGIVAQLNDPNPHGLELIRSVVMLGFSGLIVFMTCIRRAPVAVAAGWEPRVAAFLGTFLIVGMPVLPASQVDPAWLTVGVVLMIVGLLASIYALSWLGRSFAIGAAARKLVTRGPYRMVRHPLYAFELLMVLGAVIANPSALAALFGLTTMLLLGVRTIYEERVLTAAFPEYAEYARRVPRFVPRPWNWLRSKALAGG